MSAKRYVNVMAGTVVHDPDYVLIEPEREKPVRTMKGTQCGLCGQKFDYGVGYGYACPSSRCPIAERVRMLS